MATIAYLADCPQLLAALAAGYEREWPDWYGPGGASASADLRQRARRSGLPLGLVAVADGVAAGACALTAESGPVRRAFGPWLGGLWVHPDHRRRRVGSALVERAVVESGRQGFPQLYTATRDAHPLFRSLGWRLREEVTADGEALAVFDTDTVVLPAH